MHGDRSALSDGHTQYIFTSHQGMTTGTEQSSVLGGRWKKKVHSERVVVERSKPVSHVRKVGIGSSEQDLTDDDMMIQRTSSVAR